MELISPAFVPFEPLPGTSCINVACQCVILAVPSCIIGNIPKALLQKASETGKHVLRRVRLVLRETGMRSKPTSRCEVSLVGPHKANSRRKG